MAGKTGLGLVALVLVIIGGLNWALYAFKFNLVSLLFGWAPVVEKIVYLLVGISAIYLLFTGFKKE